VWIPKAIDHYGLLVSTYFLVVVECTPWPVVFASSPPRPLSLFPSVCFVGRRTRVVGRSSTWTFFFTHPHPQKNTQHYHFSDNDRTLAFTLLQSSSFRIAPSSSLTLVLYLTLHYTSINNCILLLHAHLSSFRLGFGSLFVQFNLGVLASMAGLSRPRLLWDLNFLFFSFLLFSVSSSVSLFFFVLCKQDPSFPTPPCIITVYARTYITYTPYTHTYIQLFCK